MVFQLQIYEIRTISCCRQTLHKENKLSYTAAAYRMFSAVHLLFVIGTTPIIYLTINRKSSPLRIKVQWRQQLRIYSTVFSHLRSVCSANSRYFSRTLRDAHIRCMFATESSKLLKCLGHFPLPFAHFPFHLPTSPSICPLPSSI